MEKFQAISNRKDAPKEKVVRKVLVPGLTKEHRAANLSRLTTRLALRMWELESYLDNGPLRTSYATFLRSEPMTLVQEVEHFIHEFRSQSVGLIEATLAVMLAGIVGGLYFYPTGLIWVGAAFLLLFNLCFKVSISHAQWARYKLVKHPGGRATLMMLLSAAFGAGNWLAITAGHDRTLRSQEKGAQVQNNIESQERQNLAHAVEVANQLRTQFQKVGLSGDVVAAVKVFPGPPPILNIIVTNSWFNAAEHEKLQMTQAIQTLVTNLGRQHPYDFQVFDRMGNQVAGAGFTGNVWVK